MSTQRKWLIAIPFIALWTLGLPALIAGRWGWFLADLWGTVFVLLWAGTWAAATHFYQPARHRRRPGLTRLVFILATLVVPLLAVYERTHGPVAGLGSGRAGPVPAGSCAGHCSLARPGPLVRARPSHPARPTAHHERSLPPGASPDVHRPAAGG